MITETPTGFSTLNPFFITDDAAGLITFLQQVFGGEEHLDARTVDVDGLLLHAELAIGGATLMFCERKPGWPLLPQLTQIYVGDVESVLGQAEQRGAQVVTRPTDFFGTVFSRMIDPWGNLWWVYQHGQARELNGDPAPGEAEPTDAGWSDPDLAYIHRTLITTMPTIGSGRELDDDPQGWLAGPRG